MRRSGMVEVLLTPEEWDRVQQDRIAAAAAARGVVSLAARRRA